MIHRLIAFLIMLTLVSCSALSNNNSESNDVSNPANPMPLVQWDRSPSNVVFRTEIVGGEDAGSFYRRSEVPLCTIYGDGRLIWRVDQTTGTQVLFDDLTDEQISNFIQALTVEQQIYTYDAEAEFQIPTEGNPAYEQMTVNVNGQTHIADSFSDWDSFFSNVVQMCQSVADTPTIFEPEGGWVSVEAATYTGSEPIVPWSNEASGLNITQLASSGEREWITGRNLQVLWRVLLESSPDLLFSEEGGPYRIAVEVPNVTINAPPAPDAG